MKSKRLYTDAREVARRQLGYDFGKASNYINPFNIQPGDRIVLWCRVSGREQNRRRNLDGQKASLIEAVESRGGILIGLSLHTGSGSNSPVKLRAAALLSRKHGATILAESTDRFVRNRCFHSSKRLDHQATEEELEDFRDWTLGVPAMTLLHPDASPGDVRSYQRKRGQRTKDRKGGRPCKKPAGYKKQRKLEKLPLVLRERRRGTSLRAIVAKNGIPKSTVSRWIHLAGDGA